MMSLKHHVSLQLSSACATWQISASPLVRKQHPNTKYFQSSTPAPSHGHVYRLISYFQSLAQRANPLEPPPRLLPHGPRTHRRAGDKGRPRSRVGSRIPEAAR